MQACIEKGHMKSFRPTSGHRLRSSLDVLAARISAPTMPRASCY
jgi:hypothetical protein